jgi:hypothetical protein
MDRAQPAWTGHAFRFTGSVTLANHEPNHWFPITSQGWQPWLGPAARQLAGLPVTPSKMRMRRELLDLWENAPGGNLSQCLNSGFTFLAFVRATLPMVLAAVGDHRGREIL